MRASLNRLLVLAMVLAVPLQAGPENGFGASLGWVGASQGGVSSSGLSLGGDAQFVQDASWSYVPYLMVSLERGAGQDRSDNLGGFQVRRWLGSFYVGPQLFFHDRLLFSQGRVASSQYGPGVGAVAGWEGPGGCCVGLQVDTLEGQFFASVDRRTAVRVTVGWRWR
jgi:hypothetical protein